jgi:DNA (cytosine-5)-methyltransferase 1
LHFRRNPRPTSVERYKAVPEGGNRFDLARNRPDLLPRCWAEKPTGTTDVMGRLWWDRPGFTIRTEFFKPEKGRYLHPKAHRPITHREAARIQSFPDSFTFEGSKIEVARQIGNAVPPLLGKALALHIHELVFSDQQA